MQNSSNKNPTVLVGITDHLDPEVEAMLMAMYSRSYVPVQARIPSSKESVLEHKEKLGKFYINYGHKSVGQLGSTTIWLEGVSQLAAKAIENHPLFNGQESSTRYIDFSNQPMVSSSTDSTKWQEAFRAFYIKAVPLVVEKIKSEFPFSSQPEGTKQTTYDNTIKARAFDICRGILPAGCTTNVAFTGTFDTINDHFGEMLMHPSKEMRDIALTVLTKLKEKYPYASMDIEILKERNSFVTDEFFYQKLTRDISDDLVYIDSTSAFSAPPTLYTRRKYETISRYMSSKFSVSLSGKIDFGSYRDIHRHRNGTISMECLGVSHGFHKFYLDELPRKLSSELALLLNTYVEWYNSNKDLSIVEKQYCTPMGYLVALEYECDLNQAVYIMELRSGKTVHQTLRLLVQDWVKSFKDKYRNFYGGILIHADMDKDNFTLQRGTQTFF